ncbi:hypothetical protein EZV62_008954 [Acer yangbiense]|uniref:Uncharacterized protein n=1 Tax=Acer yangbiense TaxID=1000413 RepID=A0A5C7IFB0_9ROSI|nr:hypothetical protein EZV62_008954 [Acer yangbiense]
MDPFPSIQRIYNLVRQEEKQHEINLNSTSIVDSAALQASKPLLKYSGKRQRPFCEHCNKHGHTLATCLQIHGYPDKQAMDEFDRASAHLTGPSIEDYDRSG